MAKRYGGTEAYWEKERPVEAKTKRLVLRYFPNAGKLQVAAYFTRGGQEILTKVVTLDQEDLALHPEARELLLRALEEWR